MKYFIDTEFLEGTQKERFPVSLFKKETKPTIDLISIGIVAEDGREYYAISKDFNLKEAWNRYDLIRDGFRDWGMTPNFKKVYWIRENVLFPIWKELIPEWALEEKKANLINCTTGYYPSVKFTYKNFKKFINAVGSTNKQIAKQVKYFVNIDYHTFCNFDGTAACLITEGKSRLAEQRFKDLKYDEPKFYGYFADYDWVAFCWLFGKMVDLPKGFPMYCIDLKQELDKKVLDHKQEWLANKVNVDFDMLTHIQTLPNYPKQTNEHNALADARWNKKLYEFLQTL
jgi:hypothetical protein